MMYSMGPNMLALITVVTVLAFSFSFPFIMLKFVTPICDRKGIALWPISKGFLDEDDKRKLEQKAFKKNRKQLNKTDSSKINLKAYKDEIEQLAKLDGSIISLQHDLGSYIESGGKDEEIISLTVDSIENKKIEAEEIVKFLESETELEKEKSLNEKGLLLMNKAMQ